MKNYIFLYLIIFCNCFNTIAQDIFRFEHFSSKDGLSQNTVTSLLCDEKGYLWIGTMNGLNRYDGYQFKIYKNNIDNPTLTNNRIIDLWQDQNEFIWLKTYDNYYHYLNPKTEKFKTLPEYSAHNSNKTNHAICYTQQSKNNIWVGTSNGGVYQLNYDPIADTYRQSHYTDKGRYSISNKKVKFIYTDKDSIVWIGTEKGLNLLTWKDQKSQSFDFQHLFINYSFTSAIAVNQELWFGTDQGIITYDTQTQTFNELNKDITSDIHHTPIKKLFLSSTGIVLVALEKGGLMAYNPKNNQWQNIKTHGENIIDVYFDKHNNAWVTAIEFGLTRLDLITLESHFYNLTKSTYKSITDLERHIFFEDSDSSLWIGLHGSGLQLYNYEKDEFKGYTNNINDPNSLSSNIVHAITEDASGIIWLGTGQFGGGLEKVIKRNTACKHLTPIATPKQVSANVIRSLKQDKNGCIWVGTKSGDLHVLNQDFTKLHTFSNFPINNSVMDNVNVYTIYIDDDQYLWLGSKGEGILVSKTPIPASTKDYKNIKFIHYKHSATDTTSLPSDKIYSISKGVTKGEVWIGTFENGIARTNAKNIKSLTFKNYNSNNCNLSNDLVRYILADSQKNLWVATSFGLNLLRSDSLKNNRINFTTLYHSPTNKSSISYNDIVIIKEDSNQQLWFGTFGGGVNYLQLPLEDSLQFGNINSKQGLSNDAIFSVEEESKGVLWFGSENGLSRYDSQNQTIEVFNENNGLSFNNFSESTSLTLSDGRILFGGSKGIEAITPDLINNSETKSSIELTNFQLFNKDVLVGAPQSPLKENISYTNTLRLSYSQSSFSIEFSSLDFRDPKKTQYAYMLDGFDEDWVFANNQTKATYTNLSPGDYTFKVMCTNHGGQWNSQVRNLNIIITPPWWRTTFAYLAYLILAILAYIAIRQVLIRINKYRQDLEVEKTINSVKLRFFTNISHEIRTPLTLILGPIDDVLSKDIQDLEIRKQLKMIKKNANRMLQLVNQLLDFRKVQSNKMVLKVEPIELNKFTQNIYESFIPLANHKGVFYTFKAHPSPIDVWADKSKLDSIIYNLISNAIKFTPEGKKVVVSLSIENHPNMAQIKVIDQGPGIPDKDISDIFTRYTILSGNNQSGTGIGLSLAYELAKLHGGNIELSSVVNQGSSFWFNIPLDSEAILNLPHVQKIVEETESNLVIDHQLDLDIIEDQEVYEHNSGEEHPNILIVEDNPEIAEYLKSSLHEEYNCFIAADGTEGIRLAKQENPDVIITDIMMPKMDGYEMTKLLKEDFSTCHIPIIMMTAKIDIQDKITGIETGAEAYITKPLNIQYLKAIVATFNQQRQLLISKFRNNNTINPKTLKINSKDEDFLKNLVDFIEKNYSKDLSVETLSNQCCVSRTVLYNKVKGLTGLSPLEFVRQLKLKIANQLLQKGYSVSEVAFQVGYNDIKYFSKLFKKQYGYPPSKIPKMAEG